MTWITSRNGGSKILGCTLEMGHPGFLGTLSKSNVWYKTNFYVDVQDKGAQNGHNCGVKREMQTLFQLSELQVFGEVTYSTARLIFEKNRVSLV